MDLRSFDIVLMIDRQTDTGLIYAGGTRFKYVASHHPLLYGTVSSLISLGACLRAQNFDSESPRTITDISVIKSRCF